MTDRERLLEVVSQREEWAARIGEAVADTILECEERPEHFTPFVDHAVWKDTRRSAHHALTAMALREVLEVLTYEDYFLDTD